MMTHTFTLTGPFVPYVRMTRRGKFADPRAQAYLSCQDALRWQINVQMSRSGLLRLPERTPLAASLLFHFHHLHTGDLDNHVKAIFDAAQGVVFANDCWIDQFAAIRRPRPADILDDFCVFKIGPLE